MQTDTTKAKVCFLLYQGGAEYSAQQLRDNDWDLIFAVWESEGLKIPMGQRLRMKGKLSSPENIRRVRAYAQNTLRLFRPSPGVQSKRANQEARWHDMYARNPQKYDAERQEICEWLGVKPPTDDQSKLL